MTDEPHVGFPAFPAHRRMTVEAADSDEHVKTNTDGRGVYYC